jgi:hypothetical protein
MNKLNRKVNKRIENNSKRVYFIEKNNNKINKQNNCIN